MAACSPEPSRTSYALEAGDTLPTLAFRTSEGDTVALDATVSHPGLLVLTASDCGLCARLLPFLRNVADAHRAAGFTVTIITYDATTDDQAVTNQFRGDTDRFVVLRDPEQRSGALAPGIPVILVLDEHGRLTFTGRGVSRDSTSVPYWQLLVDSMLAGTHGTPMPAAIQ
jgi:hypothetical protein